MPLRWANIDELGAVPPFTRPDQRDWNMHAGALCRHLEAAKHGIIRAI
jgi:hypothetical protein